MNKLRVAICYGGPSTEHEISVQTGKAMLKNISNKYVISDIYIDKNTIWNIDAKKILMDEAIYFLKKNIDFVFIGLHGSFGEDGKIQKIFEENNIKFSGSGSLSSQQAMDKNIAGKIFENSGLNYPKSIVATNKAQHKLKEFDFPVVVKPLSQGSSVGVSIVKEFSELAPALEFSFKYDEKVIIQEYIQGREVACSVIESSNGELIALSPTEIILPSGQFFDYNAKYTKGVCIEMTPPNMDNEMQKNIKFIAKKAHNVLNCNGYSRTDMIVKGKKIYVIEVNTLPGMTPSSILPQQAKADNVKFSEVLDLIISAGMRKHAL